MTNRRVLSCFVLVCLLMFAAGCAPEPKGIGFAPPPGGQALTAYDAQIDQLLERMTLAEKIGQMTQPDQQFLKDPSDVETLFLGSLLSGGDSDPKEGNSFQAWRDMYSRYQERSAMTRLGIPLLYGVDAVHGHSNVIGAVIFPHNIGLGATRNPELVEQVSRITAVEMRATGIHWTFAPCVTVPRDDRWGRVYEGFSEDAELAAQLGEAATRGLQGTDLSDPLSVLACAKHYLGDGGTTWGTGTVGREGGTYPLDRGDTRLDEPSLRRLHLASYLPSIAAGVGSIMPSYSSWNGEKLSGHKYLLTDVLKQELRFQGFLISDYNAIDELPGTYRDQVKQSVNAGMDMMMVPERYREFISTLTELVEAGEVPLERIDDAVRRILRVKFAMGLFSGGLGADPALASRFGSAEHREVGRDAVRQSLVLLKNQGGALPLPKQGARIFVAGRGADNVGMQCGGWTIKWQGGMGEITEGTTILEAVRQTVGEGVEVAYSEDGSGARRDGLAVVVVGEPPYAEFFGDREDLTLDAEDVAVVKRVKAAGAKVILVVLSGRPLVLEPVLGDADAIVAAWWPGTEGQGVADILFGDYSPTGKLPFSWPKTMDQVPINVGDDPYEPLFAFGYGLSY